MQQRILIILVTLMLCPTLFGWAQKSIPTNPFSLTTNIERMPQISARPSIDTMQIFQLIEGGISIIKTYPDSALSLFSTAFRLSSHMNYDQGMAVALLNLGAYYDRYKNDFRQANAYYHQAVPYCRRANLQNEKLLPGVYQSIATNYFLLGKYDSATHFYYSFFDVIRKRPIMDTQQLGKFYEGMGAVMGDMNQNVQALAYLHKAEEIGRLYKRDPSALIVTTVNIGSLYYKLKKLDSTLSFYHKALHLYQQSNSKSGMQEMYNYIATIWLREKNLPRAKRYLDSAVAAKPENVEHNGLLLQNLGCIHYFSGDFNKAIPFYEKALKISAMSSHKLNCYSTLAALHDTIGQGHLAYQYQMAYSKLKDTLFNENKQKTINQLEVQYRTSEKDKELAQKQLLIARQQNKIQQQYLWIGGGVIGILVLLGIFYRKQHKAKIAELKANLAGEEKERLRMAAELHDGIVSKLSSVKMNFDALAPAYAYTPEENTEFKEALQLLEQSIVELRTTSQNLQPSILKKAGLTAAVAIYCEKINKVASPLVVDFQLVGELPPLNEDFQLNIYRIIQELVNNMVKHSKATRALVQFNAGPRQLNITVEDNGIGLPPEKLNAENGIGLFNLQKRLKVLNGTMDIATQNGTSIYLEFDLHSFIAKTT